MDTILNHMGKESLSGSRFYRGMRSITFHLPIWVHELFIDMRKSKFRSLEKQCQKMAIEAIVLDLEHRKGFTKALKRRLLNLYKTLCVLLSAASLLA